ncbi:hypothetical protein P9B03_15570 [Metasolibacillus meyeri]|uniref:Uncharacterized protein n=1 Tax=Metasolibacillus meyeri TaxID=1071052 RepID=A0AAW9NWL6_9BACL|nr:hypothetical protein [Metasolibacillus meyeri]MEC1179919.1 hypothetical protein [Metasolibacillus meyeri]
MKKLFQMAAIFEMTNFQLFKWHGNYRIIAASEASCSCMIEDYVVHIMGERITVTVLATNGFTVSCEKLHALQIEKHA